MSATSASQQPSRAIVEQLLAALQAAKAAAAQPATTHKVDPGSQQENAPAPASAPAPAPTATPAPAQAAAPSLASHPESPIAPSGNAPWQMSDESHSSQQSNNFKAPRQYVPTQQEIAAYEPEYNIAVLACIRAWNDDWDELEQLKVPVSQMQSEAANAYRRSIPPLSGRKNIRDFIACIATGMLVGAIDYDNAPKLLYAAQIALAASEVPARPSGRPRSLPANSNTTDDY